MKNTRKLALNQQTLRNLTSAGVKALQAATTVRTRPIATCTCIH